MWFTKLTVDWFMHSSNKDTYTGDPLQAETEPLSRLSGQFVITRGKVQAQQQQEHAALQNSVPARLICAEGKCVWFQSESSQHSHLMNVIVREIYHIALTVSERDVQPLSLILSEYEYFSYFCTIPCCFVKQVAWVLC